jgi:hypothetical protein
MFGSTCLRRRGLLLRQRDLPVHRALRRHAREALPDLRDRGRTAVHPVPRLATDGAVLRQLAVDGSQRRGADLVRLLRAGSERVHGQPWFRPSSPRAASSAPTFNVVGESLAYCVVMILMAIICFQAPSLASALTGGAAVQQGIQMIQNAMMVSGLRSASSARGAGAAGAAGGVVRAGAGLPYAAGQATGAAAAATGRAAGTMAAGAGAVVRQGYGAVRTAAYKLAALRGRA